MANDWYYTQDDQPVGPVSAQQLKQLVDSGSLSADNLVWKSGMAQWKVAAAVKGLFGSAAPLSVTPPPLPQPADKSSPPSIVEQTFPTAITPPSVAVRNHARRRRANPALMAAGATSVLLLLALVAFVIRGGSTISNSSEGGLTVIENAQVQDSDVTPHDLDDVPQQANPHGKLSSGDGHSAHSLAVNSGRSDATPPESLVPTTPDTLIDASQLAAVFTSNEELANRVVNTRLRVTGKVASTATRSVPEYDNSENLVGTSKNTVIRLYGSPNEVAVWCDLDSLEANAESLLEETVVIEGKCRGISRAMGTRGLQEHVSMTDCVLLSPAVVAKVSPKTEIPDSDEYHARLRDANRRTRAELIRSVERFVGNASILPLARTPDEPLDRIAERVTMKELNGARKHSLQIDSGVLVLTEQKWEQLFGTITLAPIDRYSSEGYGDIGVQWTAQCSDGMVRFIGMRKRTPLGPGFTVRWAEFSMADMEFAGKVSVGQTTSRERNSVSSPDEQASNEDFTAIFDGRSLNGWKADRNTESWSVEGGVLVGNGRVSHLFHESVVTDFELEADVKINDAGNSGIYFRAEPFLGKGFPTGYEVQLLGSGVKQGPQTGSLYGIVDIAHPPTSQSDWIRVQIRAVDNRIIVKVNDRTVVDYTDQSRRHSRGCIALQQHDPRTRVQFKNLRLRSLGEVNTEENATTRDMQAIQGNWRCVAGEENGKPPQDESVVLRENRRVIVNGNSLTMERVGARWQGKFEIDASKGHFDWIGKGPQDKLIEWIGIYKLDGDQLKLCFVWQKDGKARRPAEFKTFPPAEPGMPHAFYTFVRDDR